MKINSINIYNEFRPESVNYLLANEQDKLRIEIDFSASEIVLASTDQKITLNATDGYLGAGWIKDPSNRFGNFKVGDSIRLGNYITELSLTPVSDFTIVQKLSNGEIQLNASVLNLDGSGGLVNDFESSQLIVSITVPITAVDYQWNFIENAEGVNFISKVDGSEQLSSIEVVDASDPTLLPLTPIGPNTYQVGGAVIQGLGIFDNYYYESRFKIIHTTFLTPFIESIVSGTAGTVPSWFNLSKCLKYCLRLRALYDYTDPNRKQEITKSDVLGNTGWFDENFNGVAPDYVVDSVIYKKADNVTVIPSLELTTADQYVEITINSDTGTFVNNQTKFALNIIKAPYDSDEYIGNGRFFVINFCFDRCLQIVGQPPLNGDYFGTVNQSLKSVTAQFINSGQIVVKFRVAYAPEVITILQESEIPNFMISVSVQAHNKPSSVSDRVTLRADLDTFFIDTSDPGMITLSNLYLRHYESDPETEGVATIAAMPADEIVSYSRFYIDRNGRESDEIKLQALSLKVKAKNVITLEEFGLDSYTQPLNTLPLGPDGSQYINAAVNRAFHIPTTEIRRQIRIKRRYDLDGTGLQYYDVYFPFFMRWEYYVALASANPDFLDPSLPNNGQNQYWHHYQAGNWKLYYEITITALKNGELQGYRLESLIDSYGWDSSSEWEPESIKSYDIDTGDEIIDLAIPRKYILGYKDTRIEALFTNSLGPVDLDQIVVVAHIGRWENDPMTGVRRFSSIHPMSGDTWMKPVPGFAGGDRIKLSLPAPNTVRAEFLIDYTALPISESFAIYVRLYKKTVEQSFFKLKESGEIKQLEDGQNKILE